jgi:hypothetical protein
MPTIRTIEHSDHYYSGIDEHKDKHRIYVCDNREMLRLLMDHKIHVFKWTQKVQWVSEKPLLAGEGRIKVIADSGKLFADGYGLYRLN